MFQEMYTTRNATYTRKGLLLYSHGLKKYVLSKMLE